MDLKEKSEIIEKNPALAYVWGKYREYALTSRKRKAELTSWRYRVLLFGVTGAILGTLCQESLRLGFNKIPELSLVPVALGVSSAIVIGLATYFGREILNPYQEQSWIRSRSMAEALKTEIYLFLSNTSPYDTGNKSETLLKKSDELLKNVEDLPTVPISEKDRQEKLPTKDLTVDDYIRERVDDQVNNFYRQRSNELKQKMESDKTIGLVLGILAIILGALGATGWTAGWIAVISTITASVAAYAYAGRYQYLIISYQATGDKLERLRALWKAKGKTDADKDERNKFIIECEEVISIENSAWMAELIKMKR